MKCQVLCDLLGVFVKGRHSVDILVLQMVLPLQEIRTQILVLEIGLISCHRPPFLWTEIERSLFAS